MRREKYQAPVHPGDTLATAALLEVSTVKTTWLGRGVFVNTAARYRRTTDHTVVAQSENSLFVYASADAPQGGSADRPVRRSSLWATGAAPVARTAARPTVFESLTVPQVRVGDDLPTLTFRPGFMDLMRAAQGTRHPVPMHTDRSYAQAAGNRDAYFSTLWQAGILGRFVTDWSGPRGELSELSFGMVDNICPGDEVAVRGLVTDTDGDATFGLDIEISTQFGVATSANARVCLPAA